ncbi:MAG: DUF819 family protein [Planctomycetota bacterium]|jgi:uncharacterized membrane protein
MIESVPALLAILCGAIVLSEWLARTTPLRHVGTALLVIVVTAIVANVGLIPTVEDGSPVYDALFDEGIGLAIFWLLLKVELRALRRAGPAMLSLFLIGAAGIAIGVPVAMWLVGGPERFGPNGAGLGAMFVGTYTGGSVNFNLLSVLYRVDEQPALYAGAAVVDSLMTTVWMVLGVFLPRLLGSDAAAPIDATQSADLEEDTERLHPLDLGLALGLGLGALALSREISAHLAARGGPEIPSQIVLTVIALVLAQVPALARLRGTRTLGLFGVYGFLAAIGALCDVEALIGVGDLALPLLAFVAVTLTIHGGLVFTAARLLRLPPELAAVASQANVGGGSSALALARSLGRSDLVLPSILLGSLGTAVGTFLGIAIGSWVLGGTTVG